MLVLTPWFLPGEQGGGSVLAVQCLVEQLSADFEFVIATGDRDFGARQPYALAAQQSAQAALGAEIHHLPRGWQRVVRLRALLDQPFDVVYSNSVLSPGLAFLPLLLRRFSRARHARLVVAPRGELQHHLMAMKGARKRAYLWGMQALGLLRGASFHATSVAEREDLQRLGFGPLVLAADLAPTRRPDLPAPRPSAGGPLRVAFVSRIDRNKNLAQVARVLAKVQVAVQLDVAGPVGDAAYAQACAEALGRLPGHVKVRQLGALRHDDVLRLLGEQELFFLPTWSENHGYVIHEALLAGCALLISDRTPWQHLRDRGVGFDLPLDDDQALLDALTEFAGLPAEQRLAMRQRAQAWGLARLDGAAERLALRDLLSGRTSDP